MPIVYVCKNTQTTFFLMLFENKTWGRVWHRRNKARIKIEAGWGALIVYTLDAPSPGFIFSGYAPAN